MDMTCLVFGAMLMTNPHFIFMDLRHVPSHHESSLFLEFGGGQRSS